EEHGKHVEFEQGIQEIKTFLEETKTDHRCNSSTLNYSASLFLNDQQAVEFVYENYRNLISKAWKPLNELHLWEITNNIRVRVRGLFFGKYRFSCKMSRFKARQTNTNLGELNYETIEPNWQWTSKPVMGNPFEQ